MLISEIFVSLQGEGSRALLPSVFVRLQGCNLCCDWCDTSYAQDMAHGKFMTVEQVLRSIEDFGIREVCVTGGEPLLQEDTCDLMSELCRRGFFVTLMTNGTILFNRVPEEVVKTVDIKTPWSQQADVPQSFSNDLQDIPPFGFRMENLSYLTKNDEVKFVVRSRCEFDWAISWILTHRLFDKVGNVFVSPAFGVLPPDMLAQWIIATRLPLRLNLQLHKFIFGKDTKL